MTQMLGLSLIFQSTILESNTLCVYSVCLKSLNEKK